jgi:hypothetical protein
VKRKTKSLPGQGLEGGHRKRNQQSEKRASAPTKVDGRTVSLFRVTSQSSRKHPARGETRETDGGHYDLSKPVSKLESRKSGNGKVGGANS